MHASASLYFSKVHSQNKSTLECNIVKTAVSIASNDVPYERVSCNAKIL